MRPQSWGAVSDGARLLLDGLRLLHDVYEARARRREEAQRQQDEQRIAGIEKSLRKLKKRRRRR